MENSTCNKKHIILVHGINHGAWCWYKVATLLKLSGYLVTALDLAACGISSVKIEELHSVVDYSKPLLDAVAAIQTGEKAVLVGHSFGGVSLALAMEKYPDKIAAAVFLSANMPVAESPIATIFDEFLKVVGPDFMDSTTTTIGNPENPVTTLLLGPNFMAEKLYQLTPPEDLTLGLMLARPGNLFHDDQIIKEKFLTKEKYGSVKRVFIVAEEDKSCTKEFQRWMIKNCPGTEEIGIKGADHMVMLSKPKELSDILMEIADKYN